MPAGRPTKYTPELLKKCWHYVEHYAEYGDAFPSDLGLSLAIDISTVTLYEWAKDKEGKQEFSNILDVINRKQQQVAWNKGLNGDYNAGLVKLLLGKHGYSDRVEQKNEHTGADGGAMEVKHVVEFVDAPANKQQA